MAKRSTVRIQKVQSGKTRSAHTGYMHERLERALLIAADNTGVSRSFIIAVAVAKFLGVKDQEWL